MKAHRRVWSPNDGCRGKRWAATSPLASRGSAQRPVMLSPAASPPAAVCVRGQHRTFDGASTVLRQEHGRSFPRGASRRSGASCPGVINIWNDGPCPSPIAHRQEAERRAMPVTNRHLERRPGRHPSSTNGTTGPRPSTRKEWSAAELCEPYPPVRLPFLPYGLTATSARLSASCLHEGGIAEE